MNVNERETLQRAVGQLEGMMPFLGEAAQEALCTVAEILNALLEKKSNIDKL